MRNRHVIARQLDIARKLGIDRSTVSKVLNNAPGVFVGNETRSRIVALAHRLGYDLARLRPLRRAEASPRPVKIPCAVRVVLGDGTTFAEGNAVITGLSLREARLSDLRIEPQAVPLKPFDLHLDFTLDADGTGCGLGRLSPRGTISRFHANGAVELAVEFADLAADDRAALEGFLAAPQPAPARRRALAQAIG